MVVLLVEAIVFLLVRSARVVERVLVHRMVVTKEIEKRRRSLSGGGLGDGLNWCGWISWLRKRWMIDDATRTRDENAPAGWTYRLMENGVMSLRNEQHQKYGVVYEGGPWLARRMSMSGYFVGYYSTQFG